MARVSLRAASLACLLAWGSIWLLFLGLRFSSADIRVIPGIGPILLVALVVALIAPLLAAGCAAAALFRQPRGLAHWLTFGCALAVLLGQMLLFSLTPWM